jgi:predicted double-glycine peptidase
MRILVIPEQLRQNAALLRQTEAEWQALARQLGAAYQSLDWEARAAANAEAQVQQALRLAESLARQAQEKAAYLETTAARFEQADGQGAQVLGVSLSPFLRSLSQGMTGLPEWLRARLSGLSDWEALLRALGLASPGAAPLPVTGGAPLLGVTALASLPLLGPAFQSLAEAVWNWLHGYGWLDNAAIASPIPPEDRALKLGAFTLKPAPQVIQRLRIEDAPQASGTPKGKLYETVMRGLEKAHSQQASASAQPVQTTQVPEPTQPAYGHAVPLVSQQGLQYQGKNTEYGCTAASVEMVLRYWHNRDSNHKVISAQELLDINAKQGTFDGTGMSVSDTHDELRSLGYQTVEDRIGSNFESLQKDVEKGPVVAVVKLGMQKSGYNHAVVVTGISEDGSKVLVNDPWDGKTHEYSADTFKASWATLNNSYMVIRP